LVQGVLPFLVVADEGIVLEGVVGAFDVGFFEWVGGVFELVVVDVLRGDAGGSGLGARQKKRLMCAAWPEPTLRVR